MNGLRMFIVDRGVSTTERYPVFYSRRSDGPYYRWSYEQNLQRWRSLRVHAAELQLLNLCVWAWKDIPRSLKSSLGEHYVE